jgi:hypothetical protein
LKSKRLTEDLILHADGVESEKVLEKGLDDLIALCDIVLEKFEKAAEDFEANRDASEDSC